ncbi:MAG: hypothetical protein ACI934_000740, partial [Pseudohongiellaceae bacterium]
KLFCNVNELLITGCASGNMVYLKGSEGWEGFPVRFINFLLL